MGQKRAFSGGDVSAVRWFAQQPQWWDDHYTEAVDGIVDFFAGDGLSLDGKRVLDLGCGDGIISLGLANRTKAASVLGLDLQPVDTEFLAKLAADHGVSHEEPRLSFGTSLESRLDLPDESVDVVVTWSVFEHVADPVTLLNEIRRVMVTDGLLFIQIWPLFFSEHGSHLWPWFDEPYPHLTMTDAEIMDKLRSRTGSPELASAMFDLYASCNRITLDGLGDALIDGGFYISKVELDNTAVHVPPQLQRSPLSLLTTSGVKISAVKPGPAGDG